MSKKLVLKKCIIVGVTGQIASGKSTVAAMLAVLGAKIINADLLAQRALRRKGACFNKVVKVFGNVILTKGQIDRKKLADIVFSNPDSLKQLENIIHPFVICETRKHIALIKKNSVKKIIVLDVPLLFESGMDKLVDLTIVVTVSKKTQLARAQLQGRFSRMEVLKRINFQWSSVKKVSLADMIVNNEGDIEKTKKQVQQIWDVLIRRYVNKI